MTVQFTAVAREEALDAFDYYFVRSEQAANRFLECLEASTHWLSEHPTTGKPLSSRTRRYLMKTFPYLVVYQLKKDTLMIIGIIHEKRDPTHWRHLL